MQFCRLCCRIWHSTFTLIIVIELVTLHPRCRSVRLLRLLRLWFLLWLLLRLLRVVTTLRRARRRLAVHALERYRVGVHTVMLLFLAILQWKMSECSLCRNAINYSHHKQCVIPLVSVSKRIDRELPVLLCLVIKCTRTWLTLACDSGRLAFVFIDVWFGKGIEGGTSGVLEIPRTACSSPVIWWLPASPDDASVPNVSWVLCKFDIWLCCP